MEKLEMNKTLVISLAVIYFLLSGASFVAADQGQHKPYIGSKAFERMKQLVGSWEGSMDMGKETMKMKASYKVTAAGSALVETFHEGTPHEMVSVWHDNKNRELTMTHYCAEHNQPKLVLQEMNNDQLTMDLVTDGEIDVASESHIHSASIKFEGNERMTHMWTSFKSGKKDMMVKISFNRIP
jgi:hypothetical protein